MAAPQVDKAAVLGTMDPKPGESRGYITPSDVKAALTVLTDFVNARANEMAAIDERVAIDTANIFILNDIVGPVNTHTHHSIAEWVNTLDQRLRTLEGPAVSTPTPVSEGDLVIDNYSTNFVRVRLNQPDFPLLTLTDGRDHWVKFKLAATAGPGGTAIADLAALRAINAGATWYDVGGSLGKVVSATGQDVSSAALATWVERGNFLRVVHGTDNGHPKLTVKEIVTP